MQPPVKHRVVTVGKAVGEQEAAVTKPLQPPLEWKDPEGAWSVPFQSPPVPTPPTPSTPPKAKVEGTARPVEAAHHTSVLWS